jgi:hypothetical protein
MLRYYFWRLKRASVDWIGLDIGDLPLVIHQYPSGRAGNYDSQTLVVRPRILSTVYVFIVKQRSQTAVASMPLEKATTYQTSGRRNQPALKPSL